MKPCPATGGPCDLTKCRDSDCRCVLQVADEDRMRRINPVDETAPVWERCARIAESMPSGKAIATAIRLDGRRMGAIHVYGRAEGA